MKIYVYVNGGDQDFYMDTTNVPTNGSLFEHNGFVYKAGEYFIDNNLFTTDALLGGYQKHCLYAKIIRSMESPTAKPAIGFEIEPMMASELVDQLNDFIHAYGDVEIDGIKQEKDSNNHSFMFRVSMNYGATTVNIFKPRKGGV